MVIYLPSFTTQLRKAGTFVSQHAPSMNGDSQPNEHTSLLGGDRSGGHNVTRQFLLNSAYTPGTDSDNPLVRYSANIWHITKVTLLSSPVNILLFCVPIGLVAGSGGWDPVAVFVINFLAIIPLAAVLSFATEEISAKLGEAMGGLLNATFGNAVELIVSIIALREEKYDVVKSSMIGSILSNVLLVLGMCFFFGGLANMRDSNGNGKEQKFASITAQTTASLLTLSAASMVLPGALFMIIAPNSNSSKTTQADHDAELAAKASILSLSRGTSIILLILYVMYLVFQLKTHHNLFNSTPDEADGAIAESQTTLHDEQYQFAEPREEEEEEETHMNPWAAGCVLIVTTILVSICADYLVDSIDALVERVHISRNFIGLILIPIVGNAAEHVTACVVAVKDKMDLAMGVAIGSSLQIALFVTPFLVILGWIMGLEMDLKFETFETVAFTLSVLVVIYTVMDGHSNYLEGAMLMALYIIIALAYLVTPADVLTGTSVTSLIFGAGGS